MKVLRNSLFRTGGRAACWREAHKPRCSCASQVRLAIRREMTSYEMECEAGEVTVEVPMACCHAL